jgi:membrane-bound lytic murein transglycosylase D
VCALLASCATVAPERSPSGSGSNQTSLPPVTTPSSPTTRPEKNDDTAPVDLWEQLRGSFAMDDCDGDPAIGRWAARFTHDPKRFEQNLQRSLPRLRYIQDVAEAHQVAGEFVLLPWVESRYEPVRGRGGAPAGMWQIVPATAGSLGLPVNRGFDGRMDVAASTEAVMSMLHRYYAQFGDWRLTDYAFNAGEFAVRKLVAKHGTPPAEPVIPKLPVRNVTREHLIKLLAIACVIRQPERFGVHLPTLPTAEHLVAVPIEHPMSMTAAAAHAGMSVDALRRYNAAFLDNRIDPQLSGALLLPGNRVDQFVEAMRQATAADDAPPVAADPPPPHITRYKVRKGESLWTISKKHGVTVKQLKRWNSLRGDAVHPGQELRLTAPD